MVNTREIPFKGAALWAGRYIAPVLREAKTLFRATPGTVFAEFFPSTLDAEKGPDWHLENPIRLRVEILSPEAVKKIRKIVEEDRRFEGVGRMPSASKLVCVHGLALRTDSTR